LNNTRQDILNILAYFDIFHYPLTNVEIQSFLSREVHQAHIDENLQLLIAEKSIFKLDEFYSLRNEFSIAKRRSDGNLLAMQEMKHAGKAAKILSRFPYVKGLAISGSLSKNFADKNTDVDFFIITEANRLWIARTLLQLFYKLAYMVGKRRWFCLNYYIDELGLEIAETYIFTAMEIVTLVPMYGEITLENFLNANTWTKDHFPVHRPVTRGTPPIRKGIFRNLVEQIFNKKNGDKIDEWLMKITHRRWQKKMIRHKVNDKGIRIGMIVDRHFSKPDPVNFQKKIIDQYQRSITRLIQLQNQIVKLTN
jgi:hypothetical protein